MVPSFFLDDFDLAGVYQELSVQFIDPLWSGEI